MSASFNATVQQQVNLFNPALLPQKKHLSASMMGLSVVLLAVGIGGLGIAQRVQTARMQLEAEAGAAQLARKQALLASVTAQFGPRSKSAELESRIVQAQAQLAALRHVSGVLERGELGEATGYAGYFKAFARRGVPGLWLTGVSIAGKDVGLKGRATDPALVPVYISRLTQEPLLQGKSFASLQIGQAEPLQAPDADGKQVPTPAPYVEFSLQGRPEAPRP